MLVVLDDIVVLEDDIGDDLLWLMFVVCYLVFVVDVWVVLILCLLGGLIIDEIVCVFFIFELIIV